MFQIHSKLRKLTAAFLIKTVNFEKVLKKRVKKNCHLKRVNVDEDHLSLGLLLPTSKIRNSFIS